MNQLYGIPLCTEVCGKQQTSKVVPVASIVSIYIMTFVSSLDVSQVQLPICENST